MNKEWLKIKNNANITEIYINGDIVSDSDNDGFNDYLGLNDSNTYPLEIKNILKENKNNEVHIHINSLGGDVFAGITINNILKNHKGKTVAYVDGVAGSAASVVAFGCDEIIIPKNAYLMIHRAWGKFSGNAEELEKGIELLNKLDNGILDTYMSKVLDGVTREEIFDYMKSETWFTSEEATKIFNIKVADELKGFNYVETSDRLKFIPSEILNRKNIELENKKQKEMELMAKEIEIILLTGGIKL